MKKYRLTYSIMWLLVTIMIATGCGSQPTPEKTKETNVSMTAESKEKSKDTLDVESSTTSKQIPIANLEVHFIDVGQADSILIKSDDQSMLIDAGKNEDGDIIKSYLSNQGIKKLDYVIGTHSHEDHIGAMDIVINSYEIGNVILPEKIHTTKTYEDVLSAIENKNLVIDVAKPGDSYSLGNSNFQIVAPNADYGDELNNWSIGVRLTNGNNSFVMCGDAESIAEDDIGANGLDLSADVWKAGHHGSETSNSNAIIDKVSPKYAVISCGKDNQYGHPDASVLEQFKNKNIQVFRTDEQGTIIAKSDGTNISWNVDQSTSMIAGIKTNEEVEQNVEEEVQHQTIQKDIPEVTAPTETNEVIVHTTQSGEKYHSSGCQFLKKSDIEISLDHAKSKGLEPCSKCKPPQ